MPARTILLAGGGSGGHIYPNLAIVERLRQRLPNADVRLLVSSRKIDADIMAKEPVPFTPLPARPLSSRPWTWPGFALAFAQSKSAVRKLIAQHHAAAVVATGGFVSGPAIAAAIAARIPAALVNLDAVPGRANQWMAKRATNLFSVYRTEKLPTALPIGMPLRRVAVCADDACTARTLLGLDPAKPMLLVTGASQGAASFNRMMIEVVALATTRNAMAGWQVLHLSGQQGAEGLKEAYEKASIPARVETYCNQMGLAWRAADVAISKAGAGSVAEAWANFTPTIFFPYPYHRDQHQRLNAEPFVASGGAMMLADLIDAKANARQLAGPLTSLMNNPPLRRHMVDALRKNPPADGAAAVAEWIAKLLV